jgi:hypothetical protein
MEIDTDEIQRATSTDLDVWKLGNSVLYQLCQDHPGHENIDDIVAKVWLIGRSYAAAIERRDPGFDGGIPNDKFYEKVVAPRMRDPAIDKRLDALREFDAISQENVAAVVSTHGYLARLFHHITGKQKRSLASKYLHFHLPNHFYLYDSRAVVGLRTLGRTKPAKGARPTDCDTEYARFALAMLALQDEIERLHGKRLHPRELDRLLLDRAARSTGHS